MHSGDSSLMIGSVESMCRHSYSRLSRVGLGGFQQTPASIASATRVLMCRTGQSVHNAKRWSFNIKLSKKKGVKLL